MVEKKPELLLMTVEIGDGRRDTLTICEGDDPQKLAIEFCNKHDLDERMIETLQQHIMMNLQHPAIETP